MAWDSGLLDAQKKAVEHIGKHARLLAGPGTGKTLTLTRRVAYLVSEVGISPEKILVLTFTRAAAFELRKRIAEILGDQQGKLVRVSTLHSFALRQLLRNSKLIDSLSLPRPLRIADDWEERNIILKDLKSILDYDIDTVKKKFNLLSADWQTLNADNEEWESQFPDSKFLGAWKEHRRIFGYTLRSELVYQLKKALEQVGDFSLESDYSYLLVDEYQDLNRCDLAVIHALRDKGIEVFVAGDDDQSIYGFRHAHPDGIRKFNDEFIPSESLTLGTCVRCDRDIIKLSLFVANLDPNRIEKPLKPREDAKEGEVRILRFQDQYEEANGVARICKYLINTKSYKPGDILILMRSDRNGVFSSVISDALKSLDIPVAIKVTGTPLDTRTGRIFLSVLRLIADNNDSLALRTLLMLQNKTIGVKSFKAVYDLARESNETFSQTTRRVMKNPELIPSLGKRISEEMQKIQNILNKYKGRFESLSDSSEPQDLLTTLRDLANDVIENSDNKTEVLRFLESIITETNATNYRELLQQLSSSVENIEQEISSESVNIMTMHKAKGLTSSAVIIVAAEDEYIPGRQEGGEKEGDERRLLYVSLSRAKHFLVVTYCNRRVDSQRHTGRNSGVLRRTLTRFLRDAPITPTNGEEFVERLKT